MANGFTTSCCTGQQVIKQYLSASKKILQGHPSLEEALNAERKWMYKTCKQRSFSSYPINQLLSPERESLHFLDLGNLRKSQCLVGLNGLWMINVREEPARKGLDFTISVNIGDGYRYHPGVIQQEITQMHGAKTYETWRQMVKSDLPALKELVEDTRKRVYSLVPSYTCCPRSARLCKSVGLEVSRGLAFLLPASYN
jgi:hypothetical protein